MVVAAVLGGDMMMMMFHTLTHLVRVINDTKGKECAVLVISKKPKIYIYTCIFSDRIRKAMNFPTMILMICVRAQNDSAHRRICYLIIFGNWHFLILYIVGHILGSSFPFLTRCYWCYHAAAAAATTTAMYG